MKKLLIVLGAFILVTNVISAAQIVFDIETIVREDINKLRTTKVDQTNTEAIIFLEFGYGEAATPADFTRTGDADNITFSDNASLSSMLTDAQGVITDKVRAEYPAP